MIIKWRCEKYVHCPKVLYGSVDDLVGAMIVEVEEACHTDH